MWAGEKFRFRITSHRVQPGSLAVSSIVPALRKMREERGTQGCGLCEGPQFWFTRVPHPCVLCKGGRRSLPLAVMFRLAGIVGHTGWDQWDGWPHPPLQRHKGGQPQVKAFVLWVRPPNVSSPHIPTGRAGIEETGPEPDPSREPGCDPCTSGRPALRMFSSSASLSWR